MMDRLGHPETGMRIVHIAGTNGKGSTAAFVSSILQAAGFCVGQFTSPHLLEFTERIQVNGEQISREDVIRLGQTVLGVPMELECTMFDLALAMGILYFQEQNCDFAVLETGLGGRLDSTNGLSQVPLVSVITNIGLEHTQILGDTLEKIAAEKAGILKTGTNAVFGEMEPEAREVLVKRCRELEIPWRDAGELRAGDEPLRLGLPGSYQRQNAAAAATVFAVICERCPDFFAGKDTGKILRRGLENAVWPGRMEVLCEKPFLLADGAHNPQGVRALAKSLREAWPKERFLFVAGILADKDYGRMLEEMIPLAKKFFTVTVESSRSLQGETTAEFLRQRGQEAEAFDDLRDCLMAAMLEAEEAAGEKAGEDPDSAAGGRKRGGPARIVAFGSLYFIADVKEMMNKIMEGSV